MKLPSDHDSEVTPYWQRGPRTRLHRYFYPADNRPGFILLFLIGLLGVAALGISLRHLLNASTRTPADIVLGLVGLFAAGVGFYQAHRLSRR